MASPQTRKIVNTAPVGSIDLPAFEDNGTPYEIWPCNDCYPWHFEVIREGSEILVREWHAVDCTLFQQLLANE
ncbi:hypothetical protein ACIRST_38365 [Kitasatospora sp. NPDC101447]|uniref:hypothetical protein n=1 Tax=Kitasatospora sp. NPDC101447 TaxID=3364102 RepID=UPI00381F5F1A